MIEASAKRSTLLLVASSALSFGAGLLRTKLLALAWGPAGIGQTGLMQAAMGTANLVTGLGVDGVLAREVAAGRASGEGLDRALGAGTLGAAMLSAVSAFVSAVALSIYLWGVGVGGLGAGTILGVGAGLSVLSANFKALLTGLGAAKDLAIGGVLGALLAAALSGVLALTPSSSVTLAAAVACVPAGALVGLSRAVVRRMPPLRAGQAGVVLRDVFLIAKRGMAFTVAGVLPLLTQAVVRTMVAVSLTEVELGQMQASAAISTISTSLLAASIGPVLIPRLSTAVRSREDFSSILSHHAKFLVILYAPVAILVVGMPVLVLRLLYTGRFAGGADQLTWQIVGEGLRLPVWLMATSLVVAGRGRGYLLVEFSGLLAQSLGMWVVLPMRSGAMIGLVFVVSAATQFALASFLLRREGFRWSTPALASLGALLVTSGVLAALGDAHRGPFLTAALFLPASILALRTVREGGQESASKVR